jgi:hypothetical protein
MVLSLAKYYLNINEKETMPNLTERRPQKIRLPQSYFAEPWHIR